jgi:hypothetical protein
MDLKKYVAYKINKNKPGLAILQREAFCNYRGINSPRKHNRPTCIT